MQIVIGSTSDIKRIAIQDACTQYNILASIACVNIASGQNAQPVGFDETLRGALTRAYGARATNPEATAIGIESGIMRFAGISLDIAVVVLMTAKCRPIITTSRGFRFPEEYVQKAELRGFDNTTVGSIIAEMLGGSPNDPHLTLSGGEIPRASLLTEAVVQALQQL